MLAVAVAPGVADPMLRAAIERAGGREVPPEQATVLVWTDWDDPAGLAAVVQRCPEIAWVQLPVSGIDGLREAMEPARLWTSAKGAYAGPMAEHVLGLLLASHRRLVPYARATDWGDRSGRSLAGRRVTILGAGGVTRALLPLLAPFDTDITVVRARPGPVDGADRVMGTDSLHEALTGAEVLVLALALTAETHGIIGAAELALLDDQACVVNVSRGPHIVTDDLVAALEGGVVGSAALDVTDPEPLPPEHPLWRLDNCLVTPHTACTVEMARPLLAARLEHNLNQWAAGLPLEGVVDPARGY